MTMRGTADRNTSARKKFGPVLDARHSVWAAEIACHFRGSVLNPSGELGLHPRPAERGEGGERPQARLRASSTRYGREPGEGRPSPALATLGHPLLAARGEGRHEDWSRSSRRLAQHDTHGVEQVHRHADPAGGGDALAGEPEHPPQLKADERGRNDLPGMVEMREHKPE